MSYTIESGDGPPTIAIGKHLRFPLTDGWLVEFGSNVVWVPAVVDGVEEWRARRHDRILRLVRRDLTVFEYDLDRCYVTEIRTNGKTMTARTVMP